MTLKINSAEGQGNGTTASQGSGGNTGGASGDYFVQVSPGSGGSIVTSTAQKAHGAKSYLFTPASGTLCFVLFDDASGGTTFAARAYFYFTGYPAAEGIFLEVDGLSGASYGTAARIHMQPSGQVRAFNGAGAVVAGTTSTNPIPLNQWVRFEMQGTIGSSTSLTWAYYNTMDSATPTETFTATGVNTGTNGSLTYTGAGRVMYGRFTASGACPAFYVDDIAQNMASNTPIGAYVAPGLSVTASVVPSSGSAPLTVAATLTANGGSGTPLEYTFNWGDTVVTGPQSSNTASHTYTTPGTYNYDFTAQNT